MSMSFAGGATRRRSTVRPRPAYRTKVADLTSTKVDRLERLTRADKDVEQDVQAILADPLRVPEGQQVRATVRNGMLRLRGTTYYPRDIDVLCSVLSRVPGVVALDCTLRARHPEPRLRNLPPREMPWV